MSSRKNGQRNAENSKIFEFSASIIRCYTEGGADIIGIGDDPVNPKNYLIISGFDDGDIGNSIGLLSSAWLNEAYDCIKSIKVNNAEILININESKLLKTEISLIKINLNESNSDLNLMLHYMRKIFSDSTVGWDEA